MSEQEHRAMQEQEHLSDTEARQQDVDEDLGVAGEQYIQQLEDGDPGVGY